MVYICKQIWKYRISHKTSCMFTVWPQILAHLITDIIKSETVKHFYCRTCFSKVRCRRPVFRQTVRPSFRPQFTSTLAFKSIQMPYSLKPLHPWIINFNCSMIRLQCFRIVKFSQVEHSRWPPLLKITKLVESSFSLERLGIFSWNFVWSISRTLMLIDIKVKKNL